MEDKIFDFLTSHDSEMVKLGIVLTLGMGRDWCIENFAYTGHLDIMAGEKEILKWAMKGKSGKFLLNTRDLDRQLFKKNGVAILVMGKHIHVRYVY